MHPLRLALCHLDDATAAQVAARLRGAVAEVARDPASAPECDAALLGPAPVQPAAVIRLLARKAHVLLVAGPCPPWGAIDALSQAARQAGVQLAVVNPDRYLPSRQLLARQVPGVIGEPGLVRLHRWEAAPAGDRPDLPDALLRDLDTVLALAGRRPERVFALEPAAGPGGGRSVQAHLGFPGGAMALIDYDGRLPAGDPYHSLSVIAARGAAYADDHANTQLLYRGGPPQALRTGERAGQYAAIAQGFVDALIAGRDLTAQTAAWRDVYATADAVRRSLASGQAAALEGP